MKKLSRYPNFQFIKSHKYAVQNEDDQNSVIELLVHKNIVSI